jgi:hypothetical protein
MNPLPTYRAVEHLCTFDLSQVATERRCRAVLSPLKADSAGAPPTAYTLREGGDGGLELLRDGSVLNRIEDPAMLAMMLLNALNRRAFQSAAHVTAHGAARAGPNGVVAMLGESGAGKSTLIATLCHRHPGTYLTDETLAVNMETGLVTPYRKPLTIKGGGPAHLQPLLVGLPVEPNGAVLVPPERLDRAAMPAERRLRATVLLHRNPGTPQAYLEPLHRAQGLMEFFGYSRSLLDIGGSALQAIESATRECETHRLHYADALQASDLLAAI